MRRYSVGVQQNTFTSYFSIKFKYFSGSYFPLKINPVAPVPKTDRKGLHTHFCHPGAAVAQTISCSFIASQCFGAVRICAYPQACVCITAFGLPVVPDVYGKKAKSSFVVDTMSNSIEAVFFK